MSGTSSARHLSSLLNVDSQSATVSMKILRETNPDNVCRLCQFDSESHTPQLAKDEDYAKAVLKAWKKDVESFDDDDDDDGKEILGSPLKFQRADGVELHGYLVSCSTSNSKAKSMMSPGILLFQTGAGPQDIFLRWKADVLARQGYVVLIADLLSDSEGFAWTDRDRYAKARSNVLEILDDNESGIRSRFRLRQTILAALNTLRNIEEVNQDSIAALGWCFGGHPILELGLMQEKGIKALISYHGVFDGVKDHYSQVNSKKAIKKVGQEEEQCRVLICNGKSDPFVEQEDVDNAKKMLQGCGYSVNVLNFDGVKHGFTNPAQDYNPSDAFAFDDDAAHKSWQETIQLLSTL